MTITLKDVGSGFKRTAINENFDAIEAELNNNVLTKTGGQQLEADLDMNSNSLLNTSTVYTTNLVLNGTQVSTNPLEAVNIAKTYPTLAAAVAATDLLVGDVLNLAEHTTGKGGGAVWDVVLLSSVTTGTYIYNVISSTGVPTLALVLRDNLGYQDVKAYGAFGDNTQDDLTILQSVVVYLASRGGGRIYVPNGNYKIKDNFLTGFNQGGWAIEASNITVEFESKAAVIMVDPTTSRRGISVTADVTVSNPAVELENIIISGGSIDGQNSLAGAVTNEDSHGINIRRCKNVTVTDMSIFGSRGDGIFIGYGANDCIISNNYIDSDSSNSISGTRQGIAVLSGENLKITNNTVSNATIGIDLEIDDNQINNGYTTLGRILIQGNKVTGMGAEGIAIVTPLVSSPVEIREILILDNIISGNSESIIEVQVDASAGLAKKLTISGNTTGGSATFKGLSLVGVKDSIIANNSLGTSLDDVIQCGLNCFNLVIDGNRGRSVNGDGLRLQENSSTTRNKIVVGDNFLESTNGNGCVISGAWDVSMSGGFYSGGTGGLQCLGSTVAGNATRAIINITGGTFKGVGAGVLSAVIGDNIRVFSSGGTEFEVDAGEPYLIQVSAGVTSSPLISNPLMNLGGSHFSLDRNVINDLAVNNVKLTSVYPWVNTTVELDDITSVANKIGKVTGVAVFNTDTNKTVYSTGSATSSVWVDATGATVNTPV